VQRNRCGSDPDGIKSGLFAGYDIRESDDQFAEYNRFDAGAGINVNFRF
jgi:hypothetical protein